MWVLVNCNNLLLIGVEKKVLFDYFLIGGFYMIEFLCEFFLIIMLIKLMLVFNLFVKCSL